MSEFPDFQGEQPPVTYELVNQLLDRAQTVLPPNGVYDKLKSAEEEGRQLRVKMGVDPTSADLHLGHAVGMHQLRRFQALGHLPVIIIGDFTARIGDPSGRNQSRPLATPEEIDRNAETYIDQLGKVLDVDRIEVRRNSEWLGSMSLSDTVELLSEGTLAQVISRDDFRKRLDTGSPIALHEIVYPMLQGMDSVAVAADIEIGGVDQLYAFQAARMLQGNRGQEPEATVMMPLLRGLDGEKKMSKSLGNYIGLADEPNDMYGKIMSAPDTLLDEYLRLASTFGKSEIDTMMTSITYDRVNPMQIKLRLARNITALYHGQDAADAAADHFDHQFRSRREQDREWRVVQVAQSMTSLVDILITAGVVDSRNKARRLITDGAVEINGHRATLDKGEHLSDVDGLRIRAGKRHFIETKLSDE
ncbi:MAG TPA: tyrosine--tRNA ligase [Candidatus Saccharimonadales bacterium]|nr:tyrosine--tRNA ligase [Candidatus Saccharimonadales bacterium]